MKRLAPALFAFAIALVALWPSAAALPQHEDEMMYAWKAGYYGGMITRLDFRTVSTDCDADPTWSLACFWGYEQPIGSHWLYAAAMGVTRSTPPALGYSYTDPAYQGPDTQIPDSTLPVVRGAAILFAALGLALIVHRWRWPSLVAVAFFLAIPHVRDDLARAWGEGPLLLGFGLCAVSFGSRWFGPACGLAAAFKLTALALWPLTLWARANGRSWAIFSPSLALLSFVVVNPHTWLAGPSYLAFLLVYRVWQQGQLSAVYGGPAGFFLPSRYLWPLELAGCLLIVHCIAAAVRARSTVTPRPA